MSKIGLKVRHECLPIGSIPYCQGTLSLPKYLMSPWFCFQPFVFILSLGVLFLHTQESQKEALFWSKSWIFQFFLVLIA